VFWALLAEDGESSPSVGGDFQSSNTGRRESDESRRINKIHGELGALLPVESRAAEDFEDQIKT
jgi:hypothetical protein